MDSAIHSAIQPFTKHLQWCTLYDIIRGQTDEYKGQNRVNTCTTLI